ncbi:MAG TPA: AAA family ATPase [Candidatus Limnocylindrales bacterium]|nr:AAA family ATPase [Candidatus Limnocylindrales bacterium]
MVDLLERRAFVGRERELARLVALLDDVIDGSGRTVIVAGEAGIGKSRLVSRFVTVSVDRARGETGACLPPGSGALPYGPFVEILRGIVADMPRERLPALLGPGRGVLIRLLPELASREAEMTVGLDGEADPSAQGRLFELILGVFQRLAGERPLILVVEDIQWADASTRELLGFLVRGLAHDRVLIAPTLRTDPDDLGPATLDLVAELERDDRVDRVDLRPFDRGDVAEQVRVLLDHRPELDLVDRLVARSDGNPFFVEELLLAGAEDRDDLPPVVRDVVAARLLGLSDETRRVLRAATVIGRTVDEDLLIEVLHLDRERVAAALREAIVAGVLERDRSAPEGPPAFRHQLLREAVAAELFPGERRSLHEACAEALVRRIADGRGLVSPADLARHWDAAEQPARALRPMVEAARAAEAVYAWPEALASWQRARALFACVADGPDLASMSLAELESHAGDCAVLAGEYGEAIALGRAAIEAIDAQADPAAAGVLHNRLRWYLWESGDRRGAAAAVEAALQLIPAEPPSQARAAALAQHAGILLFAGRYEESAADARAAIDMARGLQTVGEEALASGVLGWDLAALGNVEGGVRQFREGQRIAEAIGSAEGIALAAINLVALLDRVGRSREALETATAARATAARIGLDRTYGALLLGYAAKAQLALGLWREIDVATSGALRVGAAPRGELWISINRARLLAATGRLDESAALLDRARTLERRLGGTEFAGALLLADAELAEARDDVDSVRRAADAGTDLASQPGPPDPSLAWLAIAIIRVEADALDRAMVGPADAGPRRLARERVERVERVMRQVLGRRPELAAGDRSDAIRDLLEAERSRLGGRPRPDRWASVAAAWTAQDRPYVAAYCRYREAAAIIATHGDREVAAERLRQARAMAAALGAASLVARIDALSRAARLSAGPADAATSQPADPYGFTAREREVLDLVVLGRTNQQIAELLFITRKTASVHVSNIMAKLGATNRGEAAAMARRLGLA